jgi:hypothetical protein
MTSVDVILIHVHPAPIFINFSRKIHINVIASWTSAWLLPKNLHVKIAYTLLHPSFLIVTQPKTDDRLFVTCITLTLPVLLSTLVLKSDKRDAEGELTGKWEFKHSCQKASKQEVMS